MAGDDERSEDRPNAEPDASEAFSDAELIDEVRRGDAEAYSRLYQRHVQAAYNLARQVARSAAESDDLVSEAFARVLDTLRGGRGPDSSFRAYLLTTLRHTAYDKSRADRRIEFSDDLTAVSGVSSESVSVPFADPAVAGLERSLAAKAFHRLPERWRAVLWQTEIEEQSPAEVAPLLGLSPNGVSALAYRAREGLRQAYLQVHLAEVAEVSCRATVDRLGAWTRSGLSKRETAHVEHHLDGCASCRGLAEELVDMNTALRGVLPPLLLGANPAGQLAAAAGGDIAGRVGRHQRIVGLATAAAAAAAVIGFGVDAVDRAQLPSVPHAESSAPVTSQPAGRRHTGAATTRPAPPPRVIAGVTPSATPAPAAPPPASPARPRVVPAGVASLGVLPTGDVRLHRGAPEVFDVTVRNNGSVRSNAVTAELRLMRGVRALRVAVPATMSADTVSCPGGAGTVHCGSGQRVRPGGLTTLRFVLLADGPAAGLVSCQVHGGAAVTSYVVRLTVAGRGDRPDRAPGGDPASTPNSTTPDSTTPNSTTPNSTAPDESTPSDTAPEGTEPGSTAPGTGSPAPDDRPPPDSHPPDNHPLDNRPSGSAQPSPTGTATTPIG